MSMETAEAETVQEGEHQPPEEMSFDDAISELEGIVEDLESGELGLEEAMARFERGLGLVNACRGKLERAENRVEELLDGEDGLEGTG